MAEITPAQIATNATKPQSAAGDGESVSQFSIADQIKADQYAKDQAAASANAMPIRVRKIRRSGTA